jgi:hypothetical protein
MRRTPRAAPRCNSRAPHLGIDRRQGLTWSRHPTASCRFPIFHGPKCRAPPGEGGALIHFGNGNYSITNNRGSASPPRTRSNPVCSAP